MLKHVVLRDWPCARKVVQCDGKPSILQKIEPCITWEAPKWSCKHSSLAGLRLHSCKCRATALSEVALVHAQMNKATLNMLRRVEPYVTWGTPNLKTVRELIYKRGYGKVGSTTLLAWQ